MYLWTSLPALRSWSYWTILGLASVALVGCADDTPTDGGGGAGGSDEGGGGQAPSFCQPGETRCADGTKLETCLDDGSAFSQTTCEGQTPICLEGACVTCTPGTAVCDADGSVRVCDETGNLGEPSPCGGDTPVCLDGVCVECTPGATTCDDTMGGVLTCMNDGTYGAAETCDAATPMCLDGECVVCTPGTTLCADGGTNQICRADGSGYDPMPCDAATPVCLDGACVVCSPGTTICADAGTVQTCAPDGSSYGNDMACDPATPVCLGGACVVCLPGSTQCSDDFSFETCLGDGSGYDMPTQCGLFEGCSAGTCQSLCSLAEADPSSSGCSFTSAKLDNFYSNVGDPSRNDSIDVGNRFTDRSVQAQLYFVANDTTVETPVGALVTIPPLGFEVFSLSNPEVDSISVLRSGGVYRLATDIPVVAYHHSPRNAGATNDSLLLLPDSTLGGEYIVSSYPATVGPYPSYFTAIGLVDNTSFSFTPPGATAGGTGVPATAAGATTTLTMNRFSFLNVVTSTPTGGDVSGTIITSDQPVWVAGATECANVPNQSVTYCDFMGELMIPTKYWGTEYAAPHAPPRGTESFYWRVYAGDDAVTINTSPAQPGFPVTLDKGEFASLTTLDNVVFTSSGPIMPVQYLAGQNGGAGSGDPAMVAGIPTAQFLTNHPFATGTGYNVHVAQVVRPAGGPDVYVDGNLVTGYTTFGSYEVADWQVAEGAHVATSAGAFGLYVFGYTSVTSYAYPAGMRLLTLNP